MSWLRMTPLLQFLDDTLKSTIENETSIQFYFPQNNSPNQLFVLSTLMSGLTMMHSND